MPVMIDTCVIIDIVQRDPRWESWSAKKLAYWANRDMLIINQVILAEVSSFYSSAEEVDTVLDSFSFRRENMPWEACFPASTAFKMYKKRGGKKDSVLPDFFIAAHAQVYDYTLLTRDSKHQGYFPGLSVDFPA